ncbi:thioesterase II family protein [Streptomyces smyrnaeus]|uniref:thioesterase II family protein n=1 Tax=Streptomyces smyrnaeus TaxID=1387713 RepID=UPI0033C624EA
MNPQLTQEDRDLWIRRYHQAREGAVQLVCFPHAGGSASFYFPVSAHLAPDVEVSAVQYPGRQDRRAEPCVDSIQKLADLVAEAVRPLAERPLAFFGHSMGAMVAYEVALRLEADGAPALTRLFVSGRRAPSTYREERVHERDDNGVIAELQQLSGTESDLLDDPEVLEMILPAVRSDYAAVERYRHEPGRAVSCPVVALIGDQDGKVTTDEARAWAGHTSGTFDLRVHPGGHFYLVDRSRDVMDFVGEQLTAVGS